MENVRAHGRWGALREGCFLTGRDSPGSAVVTASYVSQARTNHLLEIHMPINQRSTMSHGAYLTVQHNLQHATNTHIRPRLYARRDAQRQLQHLQQNELAFSNHKLPWNQESTIRALWRTNSVLCAHGTDGSPGSSQAPHNLPKDAFLTQPQPYHPGDSTDPIAITSALLQSIPSCEPGTTGRLQVDAPLHVAVSRAE